MHVEHGISQYQGLKEINQGDGPTEFMLLEFAEAARLYVPLTRLDLVQKYRSAEGAKPALSHLGTATWAKTKARVKKAMKDMADELGARVGSVVLVTSPQGELTPFGLVPKYSRFRVVGIFDSGFYDYDSTWAFARLADAQRLEQLGDVVSVLQFRVDDIYKARQVGEELEQADGAGG